MIDVPFGTQPSGGEVDFIFDIITSWWYLSLTVAMFVIIGEDTLEFVVEKGIQKPADLLGFVTNLIIVSVMAFFWWITGLGLLLEHDLRRRRRRYRAKLRAAPRP